MKTLIISHNPISTKNNMGKTFFSLFSSFEKEELCQFYIYPSFPDVEACSSYYRVTDKEVLKSWFTFKHPGNVVDRCEIKADSGLYENPKDEAFYSNTKNKLPIRALLRDMMWKFAPWYNKKLKNWLAEQMPTCIFVAPGTAKLLYDIALKISKKYNIPIVSYICDDYYFIDPAKAFLGKLQWRLLRNKISKLMRQSKHLVSICDEIKDLYADEFGCAGTTIMTGTSIEGSRSIQKIDHPHSISFFGNIRCNRYKSLHDIAEVLDEINLQTGSDFKLKIYTAEKDENILNTFNDTKSAELCGFLSGEAYNLAFSQAEILLHVEAFDEQSIDLVKHSISTKIPDSLASGKLLLAYGPEQVASIKHLQKHGCALVASSKSELKDILCVKLKNDVIKNDIIKSAQRIAFEYHDSTTNSEKLHLILQK